MSQNEREKVTEERQPERIQLLVKKCEKLTNILILLAEVKMMEPLKKISLIFPQKARHKCNMRPSSFKGNEFTSTKPCSDYWEC